MRAVQWISEKLHLNKELSKERKRLIEKIIAEGKLSEKDKKDIMYQGYMALPMPTFRKPLRVHEWLIYLFMVGTATAFVSGLIMQFKVFSLISHIQFPAFPLPMDQFSAYITGFIIGLFLWVFCKALISQDKAKKLLDLREPDDARLRYREEPYFWE